MSMLDSLAAVKVVLAWEPIPATATVMSTATGWETAARISSISAKLVSVVALHDIIAH